MLITIILQLPLYYLKHEKKEGVKQWHKEPKIDTSADLKVCET